jgi:hypothetical protein
MKDRASLKRKLEQLRDEQRVIQSDLASLEERLDQYYSCEFQAFVLARCKRITRFSKTMSRICTFDNGLEVFIYASYTAADVYDHEQKLGTFSSKRCFIPSFDEDSFENTMPRLARLVDVSPEIFALTQHVLPAWLEASSIMNVEDLITARTLRWIAQQLPQDTQWPDIVTGNFPIN